MQTSRLEAFTDGVVAIVIAIMVLELKAPESAAPAALLAAAPLLAAYVLSYINVGLYWANHHHMLRATEHIDGRNLAWLFWLSLLPFVIRWIDETGFVALPVAAYGFVLAMAGVFYLL
ncbi:MAG: Potassium channel [Sphingomonas bacterium]|nr:Potassium channel [Sphingomonas bacterium]